MADGIRVTVKGLVPLVATMSRMAVLLQDMKQANTKAATVVAKAGRSRAPRDTGQLAGSIHPVPTTRRARVEAVARYARYVEFGTRVMSAKAFLHPAARETEPVWLKAYLHDLERIVGTVRGA
jgi:HK97 gp10 family phage protein